MVLFFMSKVSPSEKELRILAIRSYNRCALCKTHLTNITEDGKLYHISKAAHIEGENETSARHNPDLDYPEKNDAENLILLCGTCHDIVDNDPVKYTVSGLKQLKQEHELFCEQAICNSLPEIGYPELEVILEFIGSNPDIEVDETLLPLFPKDKITKNQLSFKVENLIRSGMMQTPLVKKYINDHPDVFLGDRLKAHVIREYSEVKDDRNNDDVFFLLWDTVSGHTSAFKYRSAALILLAYFFEQCDIFES